VSFYVFVGVDLNFHLTIYLMFVSQSYQNLNKKTKELIKHYEK
jgi:hypothetical protein